MEKRMVGKMTLKSQNRVQNTWKSWHWHQDLRWLRDCPPDTESFSQWEILGQTLPSVGLNESEAAKPERLQSPSTATPVCTYRLLNLMFELGLLFWIKETTEEFWAEVCGLTFVPLCHLTREQTMWTQGQRQEEQLHKRNKNSLDNAGNRRRVERDIF